MLAFALGSKSWRLWLSLFRWIFRSARKISIHQPGIDHMLGWTPMLMQKLEPNRMHMEETERFETWKGSRLINQSGKAELKLHAEKLRICCFPEFHTFSSCERSNSYMRLLFGCAKDDNGRVQRAWQGVSCSYDNEPHSKNNQHMYIYIYYDHIRHPGNVPVFAPLLPPTNGPFTSAGSKRHDSKLWSQTLEFAAASDLSTTFPAWELQTRNHRQTGAYSMLTVSLCNQIVD